MIWDLSSDRNFDLITALTAELQQCSSGTWRQGEYIVPQLAAPSNKKSLRGQCLLGTRFLVSSGKGKKEIKNDVENNKNKKKNPDETK